FDAYIQAKKSFFDDLGLESVALMNKDDRHADVLSQNTVARCHTYALKKPADYKARIIENSISGLQLDLDGWEVHCRLIGSFNAYNLLAVYAAARLLEIDQVVALQYLSQLEPPRGRFQTVRDNSKKVTAIIDYAHTPDALKNVLQTIQQIKQSSTEIITVVGCGGDRDKTKRPKMAQIADAYSNQIIITSDNPRSEDPPKIISDMLDGLDADGRRKALNIVDRREAIKTAYHLASADAVILIAGKGHEVYQEIRGQRLPFDDVEIIKDCMMV
ncbi:MAG: UDP-N-acetylmuramyl-tripeptide synthetase, partial [Saprospiraceae bacterium]|nr:UDP-N-acetylmuramyl-tripeptide synthetase [Saprospiraceae bacterium]